MGNGGSGSVATAHALQSHEALLRRLTVSRWEGHDGCVNRICWNRAGSLLASGSDDRRVLIWDYQKRGAVRATIPTGHSANIFAVRFLDSDENIVSGGMDTECRVSSIARESVNDVFHCHRGRVKEIDTDPTSPHVWFTASEDGTCRMFDTRMPHTCEGDFESELSTCSNVLIQVKVGGEGVSAPDYGRYARDHPRDGVALKGICVNPTNPNLLAFAASDPLVRLYDRRMCTPGRKAGCNSGTEAVVAFAPPFVRAEHHTTYAQFSEDGKQLVTSYSGEQVYVFDVLNVSNPAQEMQAPPPPPPPLPLLTTSTPADVKTSTSKTASTAASATTLKDEWPIDAKMKISGVGSNIASDRKSERSAPVQVPSTALDSKGTPPTSEYFPARKRFRSTRARADFLKQAGNTAFEQKNWSRAISYYTLALATSTGCGSGGSGSDAAPQKEDSVLYSNRAAALLKRQFEGDAKMATRDCELAIAADPTLVKAYYRKMQSLQSQKRMTAALRAAKLCETKFTGSVGTKLLAEIESATKQQTDSRRRNLMSVMPETQANHRAADESDQFDTSSSDSDAGTDTEPERKDSTAATKTAASAATDTAAALKSSDDAMSSDEKSGTGKPEKFHSAGYFGPRRPPRTAKRRRTFNSRLTGHCNVQTDIKEATFWYNYIVSGSDDGRIFIWDKRTGRLVGVLQCSEEVVNCVRPHPFDAVLASSGIEHSVQLWRPTGSDPLASGEDAKDQSSVLEENQKRMHESPGSFMLNPRLMQLLMSQFGARPAAPGGTRGGRGLGRGRGTGSGSGSE